MMKQIIGENLYWNIRLDKTVLRWVEQKNWDWTGVNFEFCGEYSQEYGAWNEQGFDSGDRKQVCCRWPQTGSGWPTVPANIMNISLSLPPRELHGPRDDGHVRSFRSRSPVQQVMPGDVSVLQRGRSGGAGQLLLGLHLPVWSQRRPGPRAEGPVWGEEGGGESTSSVTRLLTGTMCDLCEILYRCPQRVDSNSGDPTFPLAPPGGVCDFDWF